MDYIEKAVQSGRSITDALIQPFDQSPQNIKYSKTRSVQVPPDTLLANRIVTPNFGDTSVVNSYKVLRTRILQQLQQNNWNTLAITSPGPDEGKTLTAINLSIALAMTLDYTVLLVDLDFRRPSVHEYFGFSPQYGISDYFLNNVPLQDILVKPEIEGIEHLVLLPQRPVLKSGSEIISSMKMSNLVHEFKTRYPQRLIIFDMQPALAGDEVLAFSSCAEATLLVIEEGKTKSNDLQRSASLLQKTNLIGSVLNKSADTSYQGDNSY